MNMQMKWRPLLQPSFIQQYQRLYFRMILPRRTHRSIQSVINSPYNPSATETT